MTSPSPSRVIAVVPAHNEAEQIAQTLLSLKRQTVVPDRIIVAADNCTDSTPHIARSFNGVDIIETVNNRHKKAGALNQALMQILPGLEGHDILLIMDADSALSSTFIEDALPYLENHGAVSGAYVARKIEGFVPFVQRIEYAQARFTISRRKGKVSVLSGAAAMFTAKRLDQVASLRGDKLPGIQGHVYNEDSLTEDYELTLALQSLGVNPISPKHLIVDTDVMRDWKSLAGQRLRWQRGYLETLADYPFRVTWRAWMVQVGIYLISLWPFFITSFTLYSWAIAQEVRIGWQGLALLPIFIASEAVAARGAGWRESLRAGLLFHMTVYSIFRAVVYWRSLVEALRNRESVWT